MKTNLPNPDKNVGGYLVGENKGKTVVHNKGSKGGYLIGERHSNGGIKGYNKATNEPIEVEGGEVVITRPAVSDSKKRMFEGKMMTNREILSKINSDAGGVAFANGGEMPVHIRTKGSSYKYGGKTMKDYEIVESCGCKHKMEDGGQFTGGLSRGMNIQDVADQHGVSEAEIKQQLVMGIKHEMEHTSDKKVAMRIALDHLVENPNYYTNLQMFEQEENYPDYDAHFKEVLIVMEDGGQVEQKWAFSTPTGANSNLTYLQQVLIRTKSFKDFFGDWERAAKLYLNDKVNFDKYYQNVSKVLDFDTLEPRIVYHGTRTNEEFFIFDVNKAKGVGRPYAYFAYNEEYAQNFTTRSQRGAGSNPFIYKVFLNIRKPFVAVGQQFDHKLKGADYWLSAIKGVLTYDRYNDYQQRDNINFMVDSQIKKYVEKACQSNNNPFWVLMAADTDKEFKYFLMSHGYDGIYCSEGLTRQGYDPNNASEFTYTYLTFEANQINLADGRIVEFDPHNQDIRYEDGGKTETKQEEIMEGKHERLRRQLVGESPKSKKITFENGGKFTENNAKNSNFENSKHRESVAYVNGLFSRMKK